MKDGLLIGGGCRGRNDTTYLGGKLGSNPQRDLALPVDRRHDLVLGGTYIGIFALTGS